MYIVLGVICCVQIVTSDVLRGPAKVETNPKFSSSYIPAAMQIIAHDTELMKYVIKPPQGPTTTTSTTMRPTPPHKPGIYAPSKPLGPPGKVNFYKEYVKMQQRPSGPNYFDRYYSIDQYDDSQGRAFRQTNNDIPTDIDNYFGKGFGEVLRLANSIDSDTSVGYEEEQVLDFSRHFEDSDSHLRFELLRQKRVPPTQAYVSLLSLYDLLNKESKRLMLNKYAGYEQGVLDNLIKFSSSTSSYQLKSVLNRVVEQKEIRRNDIITKIKDLLTDLDNENSFINKALKDIPPLVFAP
ncbi:ecdysone-inducible gene E3 [Rhynchophorus ferrugineus]|uniref:ecdysone-inducible gene E3 n=1 Tax=Rhynchophorus ferrugineus TaxID=354439 RepID=UPI003FCC4424